MLALYHRHYGHRSFVKVSELLDSPQRLCDNNEEKDSTGQDISPLPVRFRRLVTLCQSLRFVLRF